MSILSNGCNQIILSLGRFHAISFAEQVSSETSVWPEAAEVHPVKDGDGWHPWGGLRFKY